MYEQFAKLFFMANGYADEDDFGWRWLCGWREDRFLIWC